jgi:hypothetical protein
MSSTRASTTSTGARGGPVFASVPDDLARLDPTLRIIAV